MMATKYLCLLFIALVATRVSAQSEDELIIPDETDNQFPPENNSELDNIIEGSGVGILEEPSDPTTNEPILEDLQPPQLQVNEKDATNDSEDSCPAPCVCHFENEEFVVDCSGYDLTALPASIDTKTTTLNIQNNRLTEVPKEISNLNKLKTLNLANNSIKDLASGSISELPELTVLKLENNKLIEYPQDLKNSFGLTKLQELDLGGNDLRTTLTPETFTSFKSLRKLVLPSENTELTQNLCSSLKDTLEVICTGTCDERSFECPDTPQHVDDYLFDMVIPGMIAEFNAPARIEPNKAETATSNDDVPDASATDQPPTVSNEETNEFSRAAVNKAADESKSLVEAPKAEDTDDEKKEVSVGAATVETTNTGGVDKSIVGLVIAGMVIIVAGITIKKNWSSITNRFRSTPRPANERNNAPANGTSPEEVPLQDKSPV